jgi:hypothetical protein
MCMSIVGNGGVGHDHRCWIQKGREVTEIIQDSAKSFPAAVFLEDNPAARPRRSSRRDSPPSCLCRATPPPSGQLDVNTPVDVV